MQSFAYRYDSEERGLCHGPWRVKRDERERRNRRNGREHRTSNPRSARSFTSLARLSCTRSVPILNIQHVLLYGSDAWTAWSWRGCLGEMVAEAAPFLHGDAGPPDLGRGILQVKYEFNPVVSG